MKNKRKYVRSSDKETSLQTNRRKIGNKNKKAQHSVSVVYQSCRNSFGINSPKQTKVMEKYKTYIQFITNNKLTNDSLQINQQEIAQLKKNVTPLPRKNSPVPYCRGRRSAFSKLTQPTSPSNLALTQRNSFPRSQPHQTRKQNSPNPSFLVYGNNVKTKQNNQQLKSKRKSNEFQNLKPGNNNKQSHRRQMSKGQQSVDEINNKNKTQTFKNNVGNKTKQSKHTKNKSVIKESIQSQYKEKLEKEQVKLCEKLFQGIQFYRDLGRGAHALVRSAVDWNHKRKIAVKIYQKSQLTEEEVRSIERQIQILMSLNHPNIIRLFEIIQTFKTINLIMQYGGGNSLDQYIKSKPDGFLNQKEAKLIFKQVIDAVKYLHQMNITHRDIKSQNILLNKHLSLKIIDFGFSLVVPQINKNINSYCGTPTYMAPEVVSKTPHNPQLADRWSLGVLLFNMLNGHCPFRASTQKQLFAKINKGDYEYSQQINPLAKDLISKLMKKIPTERLSPKQALQHPWFGKT